MAGTYLGVQVHFGAEELGERVRKAQVAEELEPAVVQNDVDALPLLRIPKLQQVPQHLRRFVHEQVLHLLGRRSRLVVPRTVPCCVSTDEYRTAADAMVKVAVSLYPCSAFDGRAPVGPRRPRTVKGRPCCPRASAARTARPLPRPRLNRASTPGEYWFHSSQVWQRLGWGGGILASDCARWRTSTRVSAMLFMTCSDSVMPSSLVREKTSYLFKKY